MTELLGLAVGVLGMSVGDFRQLMPDELETALRHHQERAEIRRRERWERMRLLATMVMQPHCRRRLDPSRILPFPWEGAPRKEGVPSSVPDKATALRRFEAVARRRNP